MQAEALKNNLERENVDYKHIDIVSDQKIDLAFFYIGQNQQVSESFTNNFTSGFIADNFNEAKTLIQSAEQNNQSIDFILVDLPFQEQDLRQFHNFLKETVTFNKLPLLYSGNYFTDKTTAAKLLDMIDDVIDISGIQYNFADKISFLKKLKEHHVPAVIKEEKIKPAISVLKRALDIVIASAAIILLMPVFIIIAIAIKLESKGPIFYNAKRAGRGFKVFKFYKFRTMEANADKKVEALKHLNQYNASSTGPKFFKINNDPRITKVGKFLRNTSLDEIPQLFNVLKGDMSLVGNRPLPLYEAATLTTNEYVERFMAPAGITGLWQIKKRGNSEMSVEERINLDISYARKSNLVYDLWIMANTPKALMQKSNV